jgi:S1-C subfamily serine protease
VGYLVLKDARKPVVSGITYGARDNSVQGDNLKQNTKSTRLLGENAIADIAAQAADSVVNIDTRTRTKVMPGFYRVPEHSRLPKEFFGYSPFEQEPAEIDGRGVGSGVIVRSDGYILTNNHVISNTNEIRVTEIKVTLNDGRVFQGRVVGRDRLTDLALVKIDADNLPVAKLGSLNKVRPGDWAIAIGSPVGLDHTVTLGIISAIGRSVNELNSLPLIQTDAAINPGNSGGPLLNIQGEVIGINTAIKARVQNIGFSVPSDVAKDVVAQLLEKGKVVRPFLGIYMHALEPKIALSLGVPVTVEGVVITKIADNTAARAAGLKPGDVIQQIENKAVTLPEEIKKVILGHKVGDKVQLHIYRNGQVSPVSIELGEYPEDNDD